MNELHPDERLLYARSTHWVKYLQKTFFYVLVGLCAIALMVLSFHLQGSVRIIGQIIYLIGFLILLVCHHSLYRLYFSEQMIDVIVTTKRIIYFNDDLFTCDDEHEVPLHKVAAVEVQQHGIFENFLNYGIIWLDTGGGSIDLRRSIPHVANPDELARIISSQLRDA